jgi:ribonuclease BN (tRNA processing enzyme)
MLRAPGGASLCVLGSGSGGNCSVLLVQRDGRRDAALIDAGLSPKRTTRLMEERGIALGDVRAVVMTHLDSDHWRPGWGSALPAGVPVLVHERHHAPATAQGLLPAAARPFAESFELMPGVRVAAAVLRHDDLGSSALRFDVDDAGSLGFATDVGRVTDDLVDHLRGVGVLAIESNYCRRMQVESGRPESLKRRIMGGAGHLSNTETARAVERINPRHVVFLHLSRHCNRADLVADMHAGGEYEFTIAEQFRPTRWVRIAGGSAESMPATLWEAAR